MDELRRKGLEKMNEVYGWEMPNIEGDAYFDLTVDHLFGSIWTRPGLSRKTRSMLTIAMLAALGHEQELKLHIRATVNTGVTPAEVKEILMQTAVYAGVPAANSAFQHARSVYEEIDGG